MNRVTAALRVFALLGLQLTLGCDDEIPSVQEVPAVPTASGPATSDKSDSILSPPDGSLTLDDYIARGVPSHDRPWSGDDMRRAADALTEIARGNAASLPRYESLRSGATFDRIVADDNLDFFRNRSIPIAQRMPNATQLMSSTNQILKTYTAALNQEAVGGDELVELMGSELRISVVIFQMVNELLPTFDKEESSYQTRMDGLKRMKQGTATIIHGCLQTLTESHAYRTSELKRLAGHLQDAFPQLLPELSAANSAEIVVRLHDLAANSKMALLQAELKSLFFVAEAVDGKTEVPTERPHSVNYNDVAAGTLRNDGWVRAVSKSAGFSVLLPGKYNDFSQSTVTKNGNPLKTHHLGLRTVNGVTYSVMGLEGGDKKTAAKFLASLNSASNQADTAHSQKDLILAGHPGIEHNFQDAETGAVIRGYVFEDLKYVLMAEYPTALAKTESANIKKFLDSFEPK